MGPLFTVCPRNSFPSESTGRGCDLDPEDGAAPYTKIHVLQHAYMH